MRESYFELTIEPTPPAYGELFADFLLEVTNEAIEESGSSLIVRSESDPSFLIPKLHEFSSLLSARVAQKVSFSFSIEEKPNQDWIENYRRSVTPIECGTFYIHPSWHEPREELLSILIDPALAFGSGHHATTYGCLAVLDLLPLAGKRVLDLGCGSGVLAIASQKKGAIVEACDTDALAASETLKNAALNSVTLERVWVGSVGESQGFYDLIIANILASVILALAPLMKAHLKTEGILILSGILEEYAEDVRRRFSDFVLLESFQQDGWVTLRLQKAGALRA